MRRHRALFALAVSGLASAAACSFPDVTFRDDGGADATDDATLPADGGGDAPALAVDGQAPDAAAPGCGVTEKTCGVACSSKLDPSHGCGTPSCGPCGAPAHGTATCPAGGQCGILCFPPWEDCNGDAADGCEANPKGGDPNNCGACHVACGSNQLCNQGDAGCGDACAPGSTPCDRGCVDEQNDPLHCGGCGPSFVCPAPTNATPTCTDGGCGYDCNAPYSDCDNYPQNGCEANLQSDVTNCGNCKVHCDAGANAGALCSKGSCQYGCLVGFSDCNGDVATGGACECAAPMVCRGGACVTCKGTGQSCQQGAECCSNNCNGPVNALGICIACTCQ